RPHQALGMACPVERFTPKTDPGEELLPLRLPGALKAIGEQGSAQPQPSSTSDLGLPAHAAKVAERVVAAERVVVAEPARGWPGGPVEIDRIVPASGNMTVAGRQFRSEEHTSELQSR